MIEKTSHLQQYAIPIGKYVYCYRRPEATGKQKYTKPVFVDKVYCGSRAAAYQFKAEYDKPIKH